MGKSPSAPTHPFELPNSQHQCQQSGPAERAKTTPKSWQRFKTKQRAHDHLNLLNYNGERGKHRLLATHAPRWMITRARTLPMRKVTHEVRDISAFGSRTATLHRNNCQATKAPGSRNLRIARGRCSPGKCKPVVHGRVWHQPRLPSSIYVQPDPCVDPRIVRAL